MSEWSRLLIHAVGRLDVLVSLDVRDDVERRQLVIDSQLLRLGHERDPKFLQEPLGI